MIRLADGGGALICPRCHSDSCRRSKRRGLRDFLLGVTGLRPWRCRRCQARFFAWTVPVRYTAYAHCPQCGNLDLQRLARNHVSDGTLTWLYRLLRFPGYRCEPCRFRFFSLRPHSRIPPAKSESATN